MTTRNLAYGTWASMTVTNLQSLANDSTDPFTAWQSDRVDNQSSVKALDYEIRVHLPTAATSPANDQAAYLYVVPWVYDGSTWAAGGNFGTTTLPTGSEGTASVSEPNSMYPGRPMPYKVTSQVINGFFTLSSIIGGMSIPDGWSLAIRNCSGAALSTGCIVAYRPITETFA